MQTTFARDLAGGRSQKQKQKAKAAMSIYSASVKTISRSAGRSATAAAAYRTGKEVIDERTGVIFDYTRRSGVDHVSMHLPAGCVAMDTDTLWNAAEFAEKRKNSTVARELLFAQPHELSRMERHALSASIADALVERYDVGVEVANHLPDSEGDGRNFHAHIMFTTRVINADGTFGAKTRVLDDMSTGPDEILWIRKMVEDKTNQALEAANIDARVDCRSLKDQRQAALDAGDQELANKLDRLPTVHEGPRVTQIRRELAIKNRKPLGSVSRIAANDSIFVINKLRAERYIITAKIIALEVFEAAKALKEKSSKLLSKARDHINKPEIIDIKPRIRSRDLELEEAFEKFGRKYFDMPTVSTDNKSATLKVNAQETASKPAYVPSWKRRSRPDDDPSP
ncbi:conjugal transfer protein TraA [Ectopseudomonas mendocina]|jgi:hypothetical protein|nr:MobA/MobL family protein [Pseudomonas mendocina]TRO19641.1 conjugal transfer protein TraA [Pseudomonas mendocina]